MDHHHHKLTCLLNITSVFHSIALLFFIWPIRLFQSCPTSLLLLPSSSSSLSFCPPYSYSFKTSVLRLIGILTALSSSSSSLLIFFNNKSNHNNNSAFVSFNHTFINIIIIITILIIFFLSFQSLSSFRPEITNYTQFYTPPPFCFSIFFVFHCLFLIFYFQSFLFYFYT